MTIAHTCSARFDPERRSGADANWKPALPSSRAGAQSLRIICALMILGWGTVAVGQTLSVGHLQLIADPAAVAVPTSPLFYPSDVAIDFAGFLYVVDSANHAIRRVSPDGSMTTFAGVVGSFGNDDGPGTTARFRYPSSITFDDRGNLFVTDTGNATVRKVSPDGLVTTVAGRAGESGHTDGHRDYARFTTPSGIGWDQGILYVSDSSAHTIRKIDRQGIVSTLAGGGGRPGESDGPGADARFFFPAGLEIDLAGNILVADSENHTVRSITPDGFVTTLYGQPNRRQSLDGYGREAGFFRPTDLVLDRSGALFVVDADAEVIRRIGIEGMVSTVAGMAGVAGNADGTGQQVRFYGPTGIAIDANGKLYVADMLNQSIRTGVDGRFGSPRRRGATR